MFLLSMYAATPFALVATLPHDEKTRLTKTMKRGCTQSYEARWACPARIIECCCVRHASALPRECLSWRLPLRAVAIDRPRDNYGGWGKLLIDQYHTYTSSAFTENEGRTIHLACSYCTPFPILTGE